MLFCQLRIDFHDQRCVSVPHPGLKRFNGNPGKVCLSTGKVHVGIIWTMNASLEMYKQFYEKKLSEQVNMLRSLNGEIRVLPCCDTLQVKDYSRYNMSSFDESLKKAHYDQQFPADLALAYQMGAALCTAAHSVTEKH